MNNLNFLKNRTPSSLLGLALDGGRLEGVVLRRTNGSLQIGQRFKAQLSLDPLTNDVELVGREILNQLEAAGVRERHCAVAVPLSWAMAAHAQIPDLPESEIPALLQIEAERGFPTDVATLQICASHIISPGGERHVTFVAIPKAHLQRLEQVLRAARLKPVGFSLGISAIQPPDAEAAAGVLTLLIGESHVGLQVTCGGGIAALRALEGSADSENGDRMLQGGLIAREARITLGQLPAGLRNAVKVIRIYGPHRQAEMLADEIRRRFEPAGLKVEIATTYPANAFGRSIPPETPISPAFSMAAWPLAGKKESFEFLPPKISGWQELATKYASGKWRSSALAAAGVGLIVAAGFGVQEWQLTRLRSQWDAMSVKVKELSAVQSQIQKYRPWFDESFRYLDIVRQVTTSFPEDGSVTAKTFEIRDLPDVPGANAVSCSGNASSYAALQKTVHQLGAIGGVTDLNMPTRGKAPIQFTLDFHLAGGGAR